MGGHYSGHCGAKQGIQLRRRSGGLPVALTYLKTNAPGCAARRFFVIVFHDTGTSSVLNPLAEGLNKFA